MADQGANLSRGKQPQSRQLVQINAMGWQTKKQTAVAAAPDNRSRGRRLIFLNDVFVH